MFFIKKFYTSFKQKKPTIMGLLQKNSIKNNSFKKINCLIHLTVLSITPSATTLREVFLSMNGMSFDLINPSLRERFIFPTISIDIFFEEIVILLSIGMIWTPTGESSDGRQYFTYFPFKDVAAIIIPSEATPLNLEGFKLQTKIVFLFKRSSGL